MTCHDARDLFSALVDDALGADERRALDEHLATCADCGRELARFRGTVSLLRSVEPERAPAGFVDRVLDAARPAPWPRRLLRALVLPWPLKLPLEAAAVVLVAVGVVYVFRATPDIEQARRFESAYKADTSRTETTVTETTASREVASAPTPSAPTAPAPSSVQAPRELYGASEKAQGSKDQFAEKEIASAPPAPPRAQNEPAPRAAALSDDARDADRLKRDAPPVAAETQAGGKLAAPPARAERDRSVAQESARRPASPAPESRADAKRARSSIAAAFVPPDVSGRLAVADQTAALRGLAHLIDRLGAVENRRVAGDGGPIIEVTVPHEAYPEFMRALTYLGRWEVTSEPATIPAQVRVLLRITD